MQDEIIIDIENPKKDDLISRQAVINSIANTNFWLSAENWQELMKAIDSVPSVQPEIKCIAKITMTDEQVKEAFEKAKCEILATQPEQRWIPVTERLPEEDGDYFVTLENGVVTKLGYSTTQRTTYPKGFYYISNGFSWRQKINPVVAWMPLPEKYQP